MKKIFWQEINEFFIKNCNGKTVTGALLSKNIITPTILWKSFDSLLPLSTQILESTVEGEIQTDRLRFKGRAINGKRVDIYAVYMHSVYDEPSSALLLLNDYDKTVDYKLMRYFAEWGYSVIMPDYRGEFDEGDHTVYPEELSYGNYLKAGRHILYADESAEETSWYEWIYVAKYAIEFLKSDPNVMNIGAIGIRGGGEIVWKLLLSDDITCGITINAAGWLAYEGIHKYGAEMKITLDDERYRFISGLDSQSYAPFIKNPVLMICSNHDDRFNLDRAYDTYCRINEEVESAISYSVKNNGYIGLSGLNNIKLFLTKNLDGRQVFIPRPVDLEVTIDEDNDLVAIIRFDEQISVERFGVYCAEYTENSADREWALMPHKISLDDGSEVFYLNACNVNSKVFAFAFAECTNGFITASKIICKNVVGKINNICNKNRVIYSSRNGVEGFYSCNYNKYTLADCLMLETEGCKPVLVRGYGGIKGIFSDSGLISYRVGNEAYAPGESSSLALDVYSEEGANLEICITKRIQSHIFKFTYKYFVTAGGKWKKLMLSPNEFANEYDQPLENFQGCISLSFKGGKGEVYAINNVIWI